MGGQEQLSYEAPPVMPTRLIALDLLEEPDWNVNEQSSDVFGALVRNIQEMGFLEPLVVAPIPGTERFRVLRGNHRLRAARVAGMEAVPCVVLEDFTDEELQKIDSVRANLIHGRLNPYKFTTMFNELRKKHNPDELRAAMALTSEQAFRGLYRDVRKNLPLEVRKRLDAAKTEIADIDDLARVLKRIFAESGKTLAEHSFLVFEFGGKTHLMVRMSARVKANMDRIVEECFRDGTDVNDALTTLLEAD